MFSSSVFWAVLALGVFWAVGAYNRLVRLRAAAIQAFGALDVYLMRTLALVGEYEAAQASAGAPDTGAHRALQAAATQFSTSLAMARARPLHADAAAALSTARHILGAAWAAATVPWAAPAATAAPPASAVAPWTLRWEQHLSKNTLALEQFNIAVAQYNAAIAQFPAQLLAWVFGFQSARAL